MKNLKFHTGRGGQFNNAGYVSFVEFEDLQDGITFEKFFQDDNGKWFDSACNELDLQINEDGTGYVNEDHDYDTTTVVREDNLNAKQINALIRAYNTFFWNGNSDIENIVKEYYPDFEHELKKL